MVLALLFGVAVRSHRDTQGEPNAAVGRGPLKSSRDVSVNPIARLPLTPSVSPPGQGRPRVGSAAASRRGGAVSRPLLLPRGEGARGADEGRSAGRSREIALARHADVQRGVRTRSRRTSIRRIGKTKPSSLRNPAARPERAAARYVARSQHNDRSHAFASPIASGLGIGCDRSGRVLEIHHDHYSLGNRDMRRGSRRTVRRSHLPAMDQTAGLLPGEPGRSRSVNLGFTVGMVAGKGGKQWPKPILQPVDAGRIHVEFSPLSFVVRVLMIDLTPCRAFEIATGSFSPPIAPEDAKESGRRFPSRDSINALAYAGSAYIHFESRICDSESILHSLRASRSPRLQRKG